MTARSVLASFQRRTNPKLGLSYFLANVDSMAAPDDTTFVLKLKAPQPSLLDNLSSPWGPKVVGPDALVAHKGSDASAAYLNDHADGTGPYKLTSFERGQRYLLDRFDRYWGPRRSSTGSSCRSSRTSASRCSSCGPGAGHDAPRLSLQPARRAAAGAGDHAVQRPRPRDGLRQHPPELKDPQVRKLLLAAANPPAWVNDAFGAYATPARSLFPQAMLNPPQPLALPPAGRANGTPVELAYSGEEAGVQQRVADLLIAQLDAAGFQATARALPGDQAVSFSKRVQHAPDIWLAQNNPDSAFPGTQTDLFYATGAPLNIFASPTRRPTPCSPRRGRRPTARSGTPCTCRGRSSPWTTGRSCRSPTSRTSSCTGSG